MTETAELQPGDVVACYGRGLVSRIISLGTSTPFARRGLRYAPSHVALISRFGNSLKYWVESTTLAPRPCVFTGRKTRGIQIHKIEDRVKDYAYYGGRVVIFRPVPIDKFSEEQSLELTRLVRWFLVEGATYDTAGALISGTRVFKRTRILSLLSNHLNGVDLDSLFCSELVAALLQRLGKMNRANPTQYSPASLVRELVDQGVYKIAGELTANENGVFWK